MPPSRTQARARELGRDRTCWGRAAERSRTERSRARFGRSRSARPPTAWHACAMETRSKKMSSSYLHHTLEWRRLGCSRPQPSRSGCAARPCLCSRSTSRRAALASRFARTRRSGSPQCGHSARSLAARSLKPAHSSRRRALRRARARSSSDGRLNGRRARPGRSARSSFGFSRRWLRATARAAESSARIVPSCFGTSASRRQPRERRWRTRTVPALALAAGLRRAAARRGVDRAAKRERTRSPRR